MRSGAEWRAQAKLSSAGALHVKNTLMIPAEVFQIILITFHYK